MAVENFFHDQVSMKECVGRGHLCRADTLPIELPRPAGRKVGRLGR